MEHELVVLIRELLQVVEFLQSGELGEYNPLPQETVEKETSEA